jgi:hypothetical protein
MTKVATIDTRRFVHLVVIAAMVIATLLALVVPRVAQADTSDSVNGNFTVNDDSAPSVDNVTLHNHIGGSSASDMSPLTNEYEVWVEVEDLNTLHTLTTIVVTLYWDANGTYVESEVPLLPNNNTCAIFTYTHNHGGSDTWVMSNTSAFWVLALDCVPPDLGEPNGIYKFVFTPGKVAQETSDHGTSPEWQISAIASDATAHAHQYLEDLDMNWYGEINVSDTDVSFGNVSLGAERTPSTTAISATYISNDAFLEQVMTTATWNSPTKNLTLDENGGVLANGTFSIEADDDIGPVPGAVFVKASGYTSFGTDDTINDVMTAEGGHLVTTNYLWLTLADAGIPPVQYSGTIWYAIADNGVV